MALTLEERLMIEYLTRQDYSIRRISRELGISRITVKRYLENPGKEKYCRIKPYTSKLDPYKEYITNRLKDYPVLEQLSKNMGAMRNLRRQLKKK